MDLDNYPELDSSHLRDARLYATREDMAVAVTRRGGRIAEVGVAQGLFSEFLIDALEPSEFVGIDLFRMHEEPVIWGNPPGHYFGDRTQLEHFRPLFRDRPFVRTSEGLSHEALEREPDAHFDMIYVDACHLYEDIKRDTEVAARKVRPDGVLIFNDYILMDPYSSTLYGVVQAVNELVATSDWKIIGFAFQKQMFCDIALKRS